MTCSRQQGQSLPFPHRHPRDDVTKRPCRSAFDIPPKQAWKDSLGMSEPRERSSAGRVPASHAGGSWFEASRSHWGSEIPAKPKVVS